MDISPGHQVATQIGDSVVLRCSVTGCETPSFSWRTQRDSPLNGIVSSDRTESTVTLTSVSLENEDHYLCTVTCGRRKMEKEVQMKVYCKCFSKLCISFYALTGKKCELWQAVRSICS